MKRMLTFLNRNIKEMSRDPLVYVFCLGFPLVMLILFSVINQYTGDNTPMFDSLALIPGVMMFSFTFVMLHMSLLVSKDKSSVLLKRLYTSPMKPHEFVLGYAIIGIIIGLVQALCTIIFGFFISLIKGENYLSITSCLLLIISQIPILIFYVFAGILFGTILNDKSAPGICSIIISASGILGGCWMPLETMGGFKVFCTYLPFFPSVCLGRIVTNAKTITGEGYSISDIGTIGLVLFIIYIIIVPILSVIVFNKKKLD